MDVHGSERACRNKPRSVPLSSLLADFALGELPDIDVDSLHLDSRGMRFGGLFFALEGTKTNGSDYIGEAVEKGAVAVLREAAESPAAGTETVPVLEISDLCAKVGLIASRFYGNPSSRQKVLGVTGTNGKTTVAWQYAHAMEQAGKPCAMLGTLGYGMPEDLHSASLTTPDPIVAQSNLAVLENRAAHVAMEVSSHALAQSRVVGVEFDIALLTNITRDHMNYHGDFTAYAAAKHRLFEFSTLEYAILNLDDAFGQQWAEELAPHLPVYGYSVDAERGNGGIEGCQLILGAMRSTGNLAASTPWGEAEFAFPRLSKFPLRSGFYHPGNILAVLGALCLADIPLHDAVEFLQRCPPVPGRMECYGGLGQPLLVVDYAHTPDALDYALRSLRAAVQGTLICVFGCGGDRDCGKRAKMGAVACRWADQIIITDDNPRQEDPQRIVDDILSGISDVRKVTVILDRASAIRAAVEQAQETDVVLVAGKGHEDYQEYSDYRRPYSDRVLAQALLGDAEG
ncbi:MAG: UDP-N-acetylmuramoyl-L-alanyl-D-glutamate--2,6-diaminopimelate ligase [Candidatus Eutrophobiaceae bacterium]